MRLLIAGGTGGSNIGESFHRAALELGHVSKIVDSRISAAGSRIWRTLNWRFLDHRPCNLNGYNQILRAEIKRFLPQVFLTTGIAPVVAETIAYATAIGSVVLNFSTDDPWNPSQRSRRFLNTISQYDAIFNPRERNRDDFLEAGAKDVVQLHFGYDPALSVPIDLPETDEFDVLFVGGGDVDRVRIIEQLISANLRVQIVGDQWPKQLRKYVIGHLTPKEIGLKTAQAPISLILPREANRDGHTMRSYEAAAIGASILAKDTIDHRGMYGPTVEYFSGSIDMVEKAKLLMRDRDRRNNLRRLVREKIANPSATYQCRLQTMLNRAINCQGT